jgi:hypothetical protein
MKAYAVLTALVPFYVHTAAACSAVHNRIVNALFGTTLAFSQGVNGFLTLERYIVLHPHIKVCESVLPFI